jgi:hypothetical protein
MGIGIAGLSGGGREQEGSLGGKAGVAGGACGWGGGEGVGFARRRGGGGRLKDLAMALCANCGYVARLAMGSKAAVIQIC